MNKHKPYFLLELTWLIVAIFCAGLGIYALTQPEFGSKYMFFIFSILSLLMYFMRRHMRKNNMYNKSND